MDFDPDILERTWRFARRDPNFVPCFFETLGDRYPSARRLVERLFRGKDTKSALSAFAVKIDAHVREPSWLSSAVAMLAAAPDVVAPPHVVDWIAEVLVDTIASSIGPEWRPEWREAWLDAFDTIRAHTAVRLVTRPMRATPPTPSPPSPR